MSIKGIIDVIHGNSEDSDVVKLSLKVLNTINNVSAKLKEVQTI